MTSVLQETGTAAAGRAPIAYVAAGLLALLALYLLLRLLIWDRVNAETPNQEEPLLGAAGTEGPGREGPGA